MTDTSKEATDAICHKIIRHVADGARWGSEGDLAGVIDTIRALSAERDAARDAALVEAANIATYAGAQQMPSDGSYSHHDPVMGPDVADAILALRHPDATPKETK